MLSVLVGVVFGGLVLFSVYTQYNDHKALNEVINFINAQIQASAKAQPAK